MYFFMKRNLKIILTVCLCMGFSQLLISCGGGDSDSGDGSRAQLINGDKTSLTVGLSFSNSIAEDETTYYSFIGGKGKTYKLTTRGIGNTKNSDGLLKDIGIAVHRSDNYAEESVIVYSIFGWVDEEIIFTAPENQSYFVEVYGVTEADYKIHLDEVSVESLGLSFSSDLTLLAEVGVVPKVKTLPLAGVYGQLSVDVVEGGSGAWFQTDIVEDTGNKNIQFAPLFPPAVQMSERLVARVSLALSTDFLVFKDINVVYTSIVFEGIDPMQYGQIGNKTIEIPSEDYGNIEVEIDFSPSWLEIENSRILKWLPTGFMLESNSSYQYGIKFTQNNEELIIQKEVTVTDSRDRSPNVMASAHYWPSSGDIYDYDGDGKKELFIADSVRSVYTLEFDEGQFYREWSYPFKLSGLGAVVSSGKDVNNDGAPESFICGETGYLFDVKNRKVLQKYEVPSQCYSPIIEDVNSDGNYEVIFAERFGSNVWRIHILDALTGSEVWLSERFEYVHVKPTRPYHLELAIGNLDADVAKEIVASSGHVFEVGSWVSEWVYDNPGGFGASIYIGDIDGIAGDEIVADFPAASVGELDGIHAYSVITKSKILDSLDQIVGLWDLDNDGTEELLIIDSVDSSIDVVDRDNSFDVFAYDSALEEVVLMKTLGTWGSSLHYFNVDDIDNDGEQEYFGYSSSGFKIYNPDLDEYEWELTASPESVFSRNGVMSVPVAGVEQILLSDAIYGNYSLSKLNVTEKSSDQMFSTYHSIQALCSGDLLGNESHDVVSLVKTGAASGKTLSILNMETEMISYSFDLTGRFDVRSCTVGDVIPGGGREIVMLAAGDRYSHTSVITVINPQDGVIIESSFTGYPDKVLVTDLDQNSELEILVTTLGELRKYSISENSLTLESVHNAPGVKDVVYGDVNSNGSDEIFVLRSDGTTDLAIDVLNSNVSLMYSYNVPWGATSLGINNSVASQKRNLLIGFLIDPMDREGKLAEIAPFSGETVWESESLIGEVNSEYLFYSGLGYDSQLLFSTTLGAIYLTR